MQAVQTRSEIAHQECQKNPIFLLQRRVVRVTGLPDWILYQDDDFWLSKDQIPFWMDGDDKEKTMALVDQEDVEDDGLLLIADQPGMESLLMDVGYCGGDRTYAVETWVTESVWFTRSEADRWVDQHKYNYPDGSRVFCISACGELAGKLND